MGKAPSFPRSRRPPAAVVRVLSLQRRGLHVDCLVLDPLGTSTTGDGWARSSNPRRTRGPEETRLIREVWEAWQPKFYSHPYYLAFLRGIKHHRPIYPCSSPPFPPPFQQFLKTGKKRKDSKSQQPLRTPKAMIQTPPSSPLSNGGPQPFPLPNRKPSSPRPARRSPAPTRPPRAGTPRAPSACPSGPTTVSGRAPGTRGAAPRARGPPAAWRPCRGCRRCAGGRCPSGCS